jgi:hypothetical protein
MKPLAGYVGLLCAGLLLGSGCTTPQPASFSHATSPGWASVEIREGVTYDRAWDMVFSILSREFDMVTAMKDDGYIQTGWLHTWSGMYQEDYRVRVTVKFAADRKTLRVRSEAWMLNGRNWLIGTDARLMSTLKTDLMGTIGRTTR